MAGESDRDAQGITDHLIADALALSVRSDDYWECIAALRALGDQRTFDAAAALLTSPDSEKRCLGINVLSQIDVGASWLRQKPSNEARFNREAVDLLLPMVETETDDTVLDMLFTALGHLNDPRCIGPVRAHRHHPDASVRHSVVLAMLTHEEDEAVETLIELSSDEDAHVRDWATFGLGRQVDELDSPEIRDALVARLDDPDEDTRQEAVWSLALRGDAHAMEPLLKAIIDEGDEMYDWVDEAAIALATATADPRLRERLTQLREYYDDNDPKNVSLIESLDEALAVYSG